VNPSNRPTTKETQVLQRTRNGLARLPATARATTHRVHARSLAAGRPDRGDVPGWVLVTLMTAGLVLAIWAVAGPALTGVFTSSIQRVTGQIGG